MEVELEGIKFKLRDNISFGIAKMYGIKRLADIRSEIASLQESYEGDEDNINGIFKHVFNPEIQEKLTSLVDEIGSEMILESKLDGKKVDIDIDDMNYETILSMGFLMISPHDSSKKKITK